jgi:ferredoxin--NADP+ reductase
MHAVTPASPVEGRVVATERCTASKKAAGVVRHIAFDVSGTPLAGAFTPGQSFGVLPPGMDANGKPHKLRLYSLASSSAGEDGFGKDGLGAIVATTVKRTIDEHHDTHKLFLGVCSNYLCDLQVGDKVMLTGPSGKRFVLPKRPEEHDYVFVATGTGIAPFRGMLLDILRFAPRSRVALLMGSPYATDLIYHDVLEGLAKSHPNFAYVTALSRERQPDGAGSMYVHERFRTHGDLLRSILDSERGLVYVCGIAGMELGVLQGVAGLLRGDGLSAYLDADGEALAQPKAWTRTMIHKQVRPTRRVFLEVY